MKKSIKFLGMLGVALALFMGCNPTTGTETPSGGTEQPGIPQGGGETPSDGENGNPTSKTTFWSENPGTLEGGYWDEAKEIIEEDGYKVVKIYTKQYSKFSYTLTTPIDISNKRIVVTAKYVDAPNTEGCETWVKGSGTFKFGFASDETHSSEIAVNENGNTGFITDLTKDYVDYKADDIWKEWTDDNSISEADYTKIKTIKIIPQDNAGCIYIKDIKFVAKD
ncbi:MAG: hypothetical protein HUK25_01125 [Treponema sp.]|nr:hypothetical protein [Treponema sp.]